MDTSPHGGRIRVQHVAMDTYPHGGRIRVQQDSAASLQEVPHFDFVVFVDQLVKHLQVLCQFHAILPCQTGIQTS